jgi:hypothetical protein
MLIIISFDHLLAEISNTGPAIKQKRLITHLHFEAGRIATVFQMGRCRTSDTTPTTPYLYPNGHSQYSQTEHF